MQEVAGLNWMEELPKRVPLIDPILSFIFGFIFLLIFLAFMLFGGVEQFSPNIYSILQMILFCSLLVYLLNYNRYLFNRTKIIVQELNIIPGSEKQLFDRFRVIFFDSKRFYAIVFLVTIPFLVMNYQEHLDFSNTLLNIYNIALYIFMLYLMAAALSLILNISLIIDVIGKEPFIDFIEIEIFNNDRIGGLGSIEIYIKKLLIYYSIGISLAIISYVDPDYLNTVIYEIIALVLLLMAGIILMVRALGNLQKPFRKRMIEDLDKINREYQSQYEELTKIISNNHAEDDKALQSATKRIEALHKERAERERILNDSQDRYNYSAAIISIIAFIMPIFTLFEKMNNYGLIKLILNAFNIKY